MTVTAVSPDSRLVVETENAPKVAGDITVRPAYFLAGQALLVPCWLAVFEVFGPLGHWGVFSLVAALLLVGFGVDVDPRGSSRRRRSGAGLLAASLAVAVALLPFPSSFPVILLAGAALSIALFPPSRFSYRAVATLTLVGLSGLCQGAAALTLRYLWLRARYFPSVATAAASVLSWLGLPTAVADGVLVIETDQQLLRIAPSFENLGLLHVGMFLSGTIVLLLASGLPRIRVAARCIVVSLAFVLWRFLLVSAIFAQVGAADLFWDPIVNTAGLLILGGCIRGLLPSRSIALPTGSLLPEHGSAPGRRPRFGVVAMGVLGASVSLGLCFQDPGLRKPGRVVVDESHSDWEWTQKPYDTEWYGDKSGYNYATMYQHLSRYYRMSRHERGPIDATVLDNCDVLILKTPTRAYHQREIDAIRSFVERGGGLYLIGDHTNVFGMTTYLNPVAARFGFAFEYDATYELGNGSLQQYQPPAQLRHASVINLPPKFLFGTSCSLRPAWLSEVSLCGYNLRSLYLDYGRRSFFPEGHLEPSMRYGWIAQGLGMSVGEGRVAAFTDSTVFSNFWYFIPGKNELFLGTVEWLDRSNTMWRPASLWLAGVAAAAVALILAGRLPRLATPTLPVVAGLLVGLVVGVAGADRLNRLTYQPPPAHEQPTFVGFDRDYSDLNIPAYNLPGGPRTFHAFYTWVQRLGLVPIAPEGMLEQLDRTRTLLMVYPNRPIPQSRLDALDVWLRDGGNLVVVEGHANPSPMANDWLSRYGVRFDYGPAISGDIQDASGHRWAIGSGIETRGGEPFLHVNDHSALDNFLQAQAFRMLISPTSMLAALGAPPTTRSASVACAVRIGKGRLILVGLADNFQDSNMGTTRSDPSPRQRDLFSLEFALLRALTGLNDGPKLIFP